MLRLGALLPSCVFSVYDVNSFLHSLPVWAPPRAQAQRQLWLVMVLRGGHPRRPLGARGPPGFPPTCPRKDYKLLCIWAETSCSDPRGQRNPAFEGQPAGRSWKLQGQRGQAHRFWTGLLGPQLRSTRGPVGGKRRLRSLHPPGCRGTEAQGCRTQGFRGAGARGRRTRVQGRRAWNEAFAATESWPTGLQLPRVTPLRSCNKAP